MTKENAQVYIVATPIGNKSDFSIRAVETLKNVDIIACEDSRTSAKLLESYGINTKPVSYHKFNEKQRTPEFIKLIKEGNTIALISDAGTPCISDPGRILVEELYNNGIKITAIPGASAITTFASIIPRKTEEFAFVGFLPRLKSQQEKVFEKYINTDFIFYESPLRLLETLENIKEYRGKDSQIAIGRELTKMFEETKVGTVENIQDYYKTAVLKGEIACMLYAKEESNIDDAEVVKKIKKLKKLKYSDKDISSILASLLDLNKNYIYKLAIKI